MGTSSIFNGRNDRNPLLPEDYEPTQEEQKKFFRFSKMADCKVRYVKVY